MRKPYHVCTTALLGTKLEMLELAPLLRVVNCVVIFKQFRKLISNNCAIMWGFTLKTPCSRKSLRGPILQRGDLYNMLTQAIVPIVQCTIVYNAVVNRIQCMFQCKIIILWILITCICGVIDNLYQKNARFLKLISIYCIRLTTIIACAIWLNFSGWLQRDWVRLYFVRSCTSSIIVSAVLHL